MDICGQQLQLGNFCSEYLLPLSDGTGEGGLEHVNFITVSPIRCSLQAHRHPAPVRFVYRPLGVAHLCMQVVSAPRRRTFTRLRPSSRTTSCPKNPPRVPCGRVQGVSKPQVRHPDPSTSVRTGYAPLVRSQHMRISSFCSRPSFSRGAPTSLSLSSLYQPPALDINTASRTGRSPSSLPLPRSSCLHATACVPRCRRRAPQDRLLVLSRGLHDDRLRGQQRVRGSRAPHST
jgi:hypothetical protein